MDKSFRPFAIEQVFEIRPGKRLVAANSTPGNRPFIGALDNNNGVARFVSDANDSIDSNVLGVNYNGNGMVIGFYHPYECIFSDDVKRFHLKDAEDDRDTLLYTKVPILMQKSKFGYLYKFNAKRMERTKIVLPVDNDGCPDWAYMSSCSSALRSMLIGRYRLYLTGRVSNLDYVQVLDLSEVEWGRYRVFSDGYLNIATTSSSIDGIRILDGDDDVVPYVTRSDKNNGIARFVSESNFAYGSDDGGCITVGLDTQTAFWQPKTFVTGQNVQIITGDVLNEYVAMFLVPLLVMQMRAKFNWGGNGATLGRMKKLEMVLPADANGEPDWAYMEQYAKNMMLRKYQQYLRYLDAGLASGIE